MSDNVGFDRCLSFINCQMQPGGKAAAETEGTPRRAVTISRQAGCGAHVVAAQLAEYLQAHDPQTKYPWTVFDQNLVEKVLEDHHLPKRLEKFMPEDKVSEIADIMDELFDLHPSSWTLVHKASETILRLAELGNVIIIGRGANIITAKLKHAFHVRLIGSLETRIARMRHFEKLSEKDAAKLVHDQDLGRQRYVKKYFDEDIDDPLLYNLVINTDLVAFETAVRMIADAVLTPSTNPPLTARTLNAGGESLAS
jgi:cytidylate kinase